MVKEMKQPLPVEEVGEVGGLNGKGNEGNFGGDGNSLYLDLGEDIIRTYICQNSSNYILKICTLYYW